MLDNIASRCLLPGLLACALTVPATGAAQSATGLPQDAVRRDVTSRHEAAVAKHLRFRADAIRAARAAAMMPAPSSAASGLVGGAPLSKLRAGELVSASERRGRVLRIVLKEDKARVKRTPLDRPFVPRGVDFDAERRLLAVAAVSQVLLYQVDDNELTVLVPEEGFGFANDVLFDDGVLVVADMGAVIQGLLPRDGVIWAYDLEAGGFGRIGERREFSNPKLLARDSRGRVHIVDGEAGSLITPQLDLHYDLLYRVKGAKQKLARPIFRGPGLLASAYAIDPVDRHWFGNVDEIAILDGPAGDLEMPCGVAPTFDFVSGLAFQENGVVDLLDGSAAGDTRRALYSVDDECDVELRLEGIRIAESRGLARVEEVPEEEEG